MHVQGFFLHSGKSYSIGPPDQYLLVPNILQSFRDISEREQAEPIWHSQKQQMHYSLAGLK